MNDLLPLESVNQKFGNFKHHFTKPGVTPFVDISGGVHCNSLVMDRDNRSTLQAATANGQGKYSV